MLECGNNAETVYSACGPVDVGTCPHQVLAATLTLSQPRGVDYAHPILMSPPSFEIHRRACSPLCMFPREANQIILTQRPIISPETILF